jgi:putative DNA primase/helicase
MSDGRGEKVITVDFTGVHLQRPTDSERRDATWVVRFEPPSDAPPPYESPEDDEPDDRPTIEVRGGYIAHTIDAAEAALLASGLPIFERGKMLVYPIVSTLPAADDLKTDVWTLKPMQTENVVYMLNKRAARFTRYDVRKKAQVLIDPPDNVARGLLAKGQWTFPPITGVTTVPTMRPDGVLLDTPGYDKATHLWFAPDRHLAIKPLKAEPTKRDAERALAILEDLLAEFPFVAPLDRSVSLAALMAPVLRGAFDVGPMIFTRAHTAGTGKSFFTNVISVLVTGQRCPVITEAKREELEKRIDSMILDGVQIISIDNCLYDIGGPRLCQATEQSMVGARILGVSRVVSCEWRGTMYANGNNVGCTADMTRRVLYCNMDAGVEKPERRRFKNDPIKMVLADRWKYLAAVLTIARAWRVAGSPRGQTEPIASYGQWSDAVRFPLIWLGQEDPVDSMEEARDEDPERIAARSLLSLLTDLYVAPPGPDGSRSPNSMTFDAADLVAMATGVSVNGAISLR